MMPCLGLRCGSRQRTETYRTQGRECKTCGAGAQNRPAAEDHAIAPTHNVPTEVQLPPIMSVFRFTASGCGLSPTSEQSQFRGQSPQVRKQVRKCANGRALSPAVGMIVIFIIISSALRLLLLPSATEPGCLTACGDSRSRRHAARALKFRRMSSPSRGYTAADLRETC